MKNKVKLTFSGMDISICTEDNPEYIREIAGEVQQKMDEYLDQSDSLSVTMAAALTAMDFCDAVHKKSGSSDNLRGQIKGYLDELSQLRLENDTLKKQLDEARAAGEDR